MSDSPLVSTAWLQDNLTNPALRIFDCSVYVENPEPEKRLATALQHYQQAHIPGAAFLDVAGKLSDPHSELQFTLPAGGELIRAFGEAGITKESIVVFYSATTPMWMTRAWWLLKSCGFERAYVLNGGFKAWQEEQRSIESGENHYPSATLDTSFTPHLWANKTEVLAAIENTEVCTLSVLPESEYSGETKAFSRRRGHIAGSENLPYMHLVDQNGLFHSPETLRTLYQNVTALDKNKVICYCGGGIAATMSALALTLLGKDNIAVYDGSMLEWSADPDLPMRIGQSE